MKLKKYIPISLIYSRLLIGLILIVLSVIRVSHFKSIAIWLLTIGLLTDVFDGIIARRLQISTVRLRRLDSTIDQVFFISVAIATYIQCPVFFKENAGNLLLVLCFEAATYLLCYLKFKKEIATHSIGAKIWTLLMFATLVQILMQCQSGLLFQLFFWVGIVTRIEIMAIIIILKIWTNDVPTVYHSLKIRRGEQIKRHKLFNG